MHTCSYYCERPKCIKAQRDELRQKLEQTEKREWVGLTDEEIWAEGADNVLDVYFARDIEAKLKEKNHG